MSLSARRAWIEITMTFRLNPVKWVALRKESVDRNISNMKMLRKLEVALRKESVDRNIYSIQFIWLYAVALRKESVDRNMRFLPILKGFIGSLSARRAWIEISKYSL